MFYNFDMQITLISLKESEFCFIDEASARLFTALDAHQYGNALRGAGGGMHDHWWSSYEVIYWPLIYY